MIAKDLKEGDKLKLATGEVVKVKRVTKGFVRYKDDTSILIDHSKGWSQVPAHMEITP